MNKKNSYENAHIKADILKSWLEKNKTNLDPFINGPFTDHPTIALAQQMYCLIHAAKGGDEKALRLACRFLLENIKAPFGVSIKTSIMSALKTNSDLISNNMKKELALLAAKLLSLKYPPREIKWYCKLLKKFGPEYYTLIWNKIEVNSKEAERWIEYFEKE